jgi:hypothetical protein
MRKISIILIIPLFVLAAYLYTKNDQVIETGSPIIFSDNEGGPQMEPHPLSIEALRTGEYPGSDLVIEQALSPGTNYQRYIASYKSEGLKIFGLLTVPNGDTTAGAQNNGMKFPAIIFNHGYISPSVYRTTEKYAAYQDAFARAGYVTFKSDYRGHGNSEGTAEGGYGSNDYTIDVLNALASVKKWMRLTLKKSVCGDIQWEAILLLKAWLLITI